MHSQRGKRNEARQVAMYLIRELCNKSLKEIAEWLSLGSYGSVGGACSVIEKQLKGDSRRLQRRIEGIREMVSSTSIQENTWPFSLFIFHFSLLLCNI